MMKNKFFWLALLMPAMANSHVLLEPNQAESGSYYKGVLTVNHGCDDSPTTRITVDIPEGLQFVQPMPKAGWQLEIVKKPVERPYFRDGIEITETVRQISWFGNTLHDIHFDEFSFRGRIGVGATSVLYFPVTQECESGELVWDQIPQAEPLKADSHAGHQHADHTKMAAENEEGHAHHQHHAHQMKMDDENQADHADHSGHQHHHQHADTTHSTVHAHEPQSLQYPVPFVRVVDGTGDHHHHH